MLSPKTSELMNLSSIFVSHKKVKRLPMSKGDYNTYRGWEQPEDEDETDDGYLVEYLDGGKPNHPEHEGYISWSPKEQFDNGYVKIIPEHEQRVRVEREELLVKLEKLETFIDSTPFYSLSEVEKNDLDSQSIIMNQYLDILDKRISLFK